jgi:glycine/D-amino acid oxidase-like deaminating enzyme/nitrite reductase/ring-hydroxylating ferredoxin subunit
MVAPPPSLGEAVRSDRVSFWVDSTRDEGLRDGMAPTAEAEVVVVGAGIVGLTAALRLAEAGRGVVVLDGGPIAGGVSGYTTAKLTAGHGLLYSELEGSLGRDTASSYASAQCAGLDFVRNLVETRDLDCDLETLPNYVFAENEEQLEQVAAETEAQRRAGLPAETVPGRDVPVPASGATMLPDQAQLHPRSYLLALAGLVESAGGQIVTRQRVTRITGEGPFEVAVGEHAVRAPLVVVATHYPIVEQGFLIPRIHPRRGYVIAAPLETEPPAGMFINVGVPTRSLRTARLFDGSRLLLVGGEGHRVGQKPGTESCYAALERYMREHFRVGETAYRWSAQDLFSVDHLPYVGRAGDVDGLFVATGFAGWGMTNGTMAGIAIAAAVDGAPEPWAEVFTLDRDRSAAGVRMLVESAGVARQQAAGAVRPRLRTPPELAVEEGAVFSIDGRDIALSKDASGALHAVSARCTHMGCVVAWNNAESSWDCPCHGSRFGPDGAVLHGPALTALESVDLAQDGAV